MDEKRTWSDWLLDAVYVAAVVVIGYPLLVSGGLLDQWFGLWWILAVPAVPAVIVLGDYFLRRIGRA